MSSPATSDPEPTTPAWRLRHLELLMALIVLFVIGSFLSTESILQRAVSNLLILAIVLSAIRTLSTSRIRLVTAVTAGLVGYALSWIAEIRPSVELVAATYVCYIVLFTLLVAALIESVFVDGPVDMNRIIGAVSIYFVFGLLWAFVYSLLETFQPGTFAVRDHQRSGEIAENMVNEFIYFSNVTLTTLGYGDIVPVSRPARMLAMLEAMTGQLYVAIVIARLVGLHISQQREA